MNKILIKLNDSYNSFKVSKNKFYYLLERRQYILIGLAVVTVLFGFIGFYLSDDVTGFEVVNNTLGLFFIEWADGDNWIIDIAKFFAIVTFFVAAGTIYLSQKFNDFMVSQIQKKPYTLVIGLGEHNSSFLRSFDAEQVLIIEADKKNPNIDYFKKKGFGVIAAKTKDIIDEIDLNQFQDCIISTGNDRQNIAIVMLVIDRCISKESKKIYVQIESHDLSVLFYQNIVTTHDSLDIVAYSLYENMAKELFSKHSILGKQPDLIKTAEEYNIAVVGSSHLAEEIVYHLSVLAHLPEENILNLYLIDKDADKFLKNIKKLFIGIEHIPHLNIKTINSDYDTLEFFQDKIWNKENLTNIIIATESEEKNLEIAINFQDTTYIREKDLMTNIHFAIYHDKGISTKIEQDKQAFANFYPFADITNVASKEKLMDEKSDLIAKLIHADYLGKDDIDIKELNRAWIGEDSTHFKRISNKAQALHIDIKLLSLDFKKVVSSKSIKELLKINQEKFQDIFSDDEREIYIDGYFPDTFETMLDKLSRSEHNRWNAFHYLDGWEYAEIKDVETKRHPCLQELKEFKTDDLKSTYKWDVNSVLNIPIYLAQAGYELVDI